MWGKHTCNISLEGGLQSPIIRLNREVIKYRKVHKLLGLFYDSPKLNWKAHIDYLRVECLKRMDIMKTISSPTWGASSKVLRMFYITSIRAKIDYGAVLYGSAAKTNLEKLEKIQTACIRMILSARKSTPVISLQAEAHIPPLELHRGLLTVRGLIKLNYGSKGMSVTDVTTPNGKVENSCAMNSFMRRALLWCKLYDINMRRVCNNSNVVEIPPWVEDIQCIMSYDESKIYNNETFLEYLNQQYAKFKYCYTDGSKCRGDNIAVGSAMYFPHLKVGCCYRLHPDHSVLFSELYAIKQALHYIELYTVQNFVIFCDSRAALQLICSKGKAYEDIVKEIKYKLFQLNKSRQLLLHWV